MNNSRRKSLNCAIQKLEHIVGELENVNEDLDVLRDEEYDCYASYPENLQESERACACLDNSEKFGEIYDTLQGYIDEINDYITELSEM